MTITLTKYTAHAVYREACEAAEAAVAACTPRPMIVGSPTTPLGNDIDPNKPTYYVADGLCGFAWVVIRPARGPLVAWLKKQLIGRAAYGGGYDVRSWELATSTRSSQSYEKGMAAARAAADVFQKYGIDAYANGRLD